MTDTRAETTGERPRGGSRAKRVLLVWIALAAGLAVLAWSQTWFTIERMEGVELAEGTTASGGVAAPPVMALALAGLATVAGLALAGLVLRWILGGLVVVIGAVTVMTSVVALADPVRAVSRLVTELTGVAGTSSTSDLIAPSDLSVTVWPWIAILAGVLTAVAGIGVIVTARRWPTSARRFETRVVEAETGLPVDSVERWDALSGGDDPTITTLEAEESEEVADRDETDDGGAPDLDDGDESDAPDADGARGTDGRSVPPHID